MNGAKKSVKKSVKSNGGGNGGGSNGGGIYSMTMFLVEERKFLVKKEGKKHPESMEATRVVCDSPMKALCMIWDHCLHNARVS